MLSTPRPTRKTYARALRREVAVFDIAGEPLLSKHTKPSLSARRRRSRVKNRRARASRKANR